MKSQTKVILIILGVFVCICCGGPLLFWVKLTSGPTGLAAGIREYKAAGLPWTADEVQPSVPPDQDGGPQLIKAFDRIKSLTSSASEQEILSAIDEKQFGIAQKKLEPCQRYLDNVVIALKKPHARFPKDWDLGPMILFPELGECKFSAKLLCDRAIIKAYFGDVKASNLDLAAAWSLGERAGEEPNLIGLLVQIANRAIVLRGVERCIPYEFGNLSSLQALQTTVAKWKEPLDLKRALRGEAYVHLSIVRNIAIYGPSMKEFSDGDEPPPPVDVQRLRRDGNPDGAYASVVGGAVLSNSARVSEIAARDASNPIQLESDLIAYDKEIDRKSGLSQVLAKLLEPVYGPAATAILREMSTIRATKALIEALIVRRQIGHYPTTAEGLPTKWIDPIAGKPLKIVLSGDSIRIYGVGTDKVDHGGKTALETRDANHVDIVVGYPPPPRKAPTNHK